MKVMIHPTVGCAVREDGCIWYAPRGNKPSKWTYGFANSNGYHQVCIKGKYYCVHRLVAETFLDNPDNKPEVDHINHDKNDNSVKNLRFVTRLENSANRVKACKYRAKYGITWGDSPKECQRVYDSMRSYLKFNDGKTHWVRKDVGERLKAIPVSERVYDRGLGKCPLV